jgi:hypothetical protein
MSQYLKEKLEGLVKRYNSEMEEVSALEKSQRELNHYTPEHIDSLMKEKRDEVKNKFMDAIKSFHSEIQKSVNDYHSLKLKALYPNLTKDSDSFGHFKLNGELQISDGSRTAQEFISNDSPLKYASLVDELGSASILERTDFVSEVLNKLQPVFDQLDSKFELKDGEQKLVDFRINHLKKTGAQEYVDKLNSSYLIEEKTRRFFSEIYHDEEFIILPDLNSPDGTDSLVVGGQLNRISKAPSL